MLEVCRFIAAGGNGPALARSGKLGECDSLEKGVRDALFIPPGELGLVAWKSSDQFSAFMVLTCQAASCLIEAR